jgi:hypothetical protein
VSEANQTPPSKFSLDAILATSKTHPTYWYAGGGGVAVVAIAAIVFFGGFFGPSGRDICTAALTQAKDYGVISPSATLASTSAKSTDVKARRQCTAQADSDTFTILADIKTETADHKKCKDMKTPGCVAIYSVARSDGMTTYQVREIPPGETDEALAASQPQVPPPPGAAPAADSDAGGLDSETTTDNSSAASSPPAQPSGSQPQ